MRKIIVFLGVLLLCAIAVAVKIYSGDQYRQPIATAEKLSNATCSASDFTLTKTKAVTEYDSARLTGIITSHCATSAGVQLKWTAFNADGSVAFSSDFWPAKTTNIPPRSDYPFEMIESAPRGKWTFNVEPIKVTSW